MTYNQVDQCGVTNLVKSESKMLSLPKQTSKESTKKIGNSSYFVISPDAAYQEIISGKKKKRK